MLNLTKPEKTVVYFLFGVLLCGSCLRYTFRRYPQVKDFIHLADSDRIYRKTDVNRADAQELTAIPYIGAYTAEQITRYRQKNGLFNSLEELKSVKGIKQKNFDRFSKYLTVK